MPARRLSFVLASRFLRSSGLPRIPGCGGPDLTRVRHGGNRRSRLPSSEVRPRMPAQRRRVMTGLRWRSLRAMTEDGPRMSIHYFVRPRPHSDVARTK